tara:strand:- start:39 stop:569 length:531 start_codon:yes stop_codon:yes gene_type:complete
MANISTYPIGTPGASDLIPGTQLYTDTNGKTQNLTRNFSVSSIATFATENYIEITKVISNAEWLALATTSVQIIPTPGASKALQVILAHVKWIHSGANFEWNQPLHLSNGTTGAVSTVVQGTIPTSYSDVNGNDTQIFTISGADVSLNGAINLGCPNGATITGGGTLSITIRYQVI